MTSTAARDAATRELHAWFTSVRDLCDRSLFAVGETPEHNQAVVFASLARSATAIVDAKLDASGDLYTPLCFTLAAICRRVRLSPTADHWRSAIENVLSVRVQVGELTPAAFGLGVGTPAAIFKDLFDQALINAGVTNRPTILVEENRRVSLGLALNWGLRFLLAYALELTPKQVGLASPHDLHWIRVLLTSVPPRSRRRHSRDAA